MPSHNTLNTLARLAAGLLLGAALSACQGAAPSAPKPALLIAPSAAVQQQLQHIVSAALNTQVTLSAAALTNTPVLIVEAANRSRSLDSPSAQGSWRERPDHFELYLIDNQCWLKHRQSDQQWPIEDATCAAVNSDTVSTR